MPTPSTVTFDDHLRSQLRFNLGRHQVRSHPVAGRKRAAVCLVVVDSDAELHGNDPFAAADIENRLPDIPGVEEGSLTGLVDGTAGGAALLLTRRSPRLTAHAHQWALPGGRVDEGETAFEAAVREAAEEVSLPLSVDAYLGRLDDYPTRSGYVISPFVFWAEGTTEPEANPDEVASIHRIALRELQRAPRFVTIPESERPVIQVPIGGDLIHAPTGAIMHQFHAVAVEGQELRVDEFEQPVFAWR